MKPCAIDGCPKPAGVPGTARGWCATHYSRWQRTGDPLLTLTDLKPAPSPDCGVGGCTMQRWARGYCVTHYRRLMTHGEVGGPERLTKPAVGRCSIPKCRRRVRSKGLCQRHYLRLHRHGDAEAGRSYMGVYSRCSVVGCAREFYARGLCHGHWQVIAAAPRERSARLGLPVVGECSPEQLIARLDYYGNRCWICRGSADQVDHVKPLSAGGCQWPANLRPCCSSCNTAKWNAWPYFVPRGATA